MYIGDVLRSVLSQSVLPAAIYVIDNACDHYQYRAAVGGFSSEIIHYVRFDNRLPMAENWQRCLGVGNAELCAFLHDDDVWPENYIETALGCFSGSDVEAVLSNKTHFSTGSDPHDDHELLNYSELSREPEVVFKMVLLTSCGSHMSSLMFRRGTGAFDLTSAIVIDQLFSDQYVMRNSLRLNHRSTVFIREHAVSGTSSSNQGRWRTEISARYRRNLIYLSRKYCASEDVVEKYIYWKTRDWYSALILAALSEQAPKVFFDFEKCLFARRAWLKASGRFSMQGLILFGSPVFLKRIFVYIIQKRRLSGDSDFR